MGKHEDNSRAADTRDGYVGAHSRDERDRGWQGGPVGDQSGARLGGGAAGEAGHGDTPNR